MTKEDKSKKKQVFGKIRKQSICFLNILRMNSSWRSIVSDSSEPTKLNDNSLTELACCVCGEAVALAATDSCSNCRAFWCDSCINLLQRKCPRCNKQIEDSPTKETSICEPHGRKLSFYCLTCKREICEECIMNTLDHRRHIFDRLDAVYQEKIAVTSGKLNQLKQHIEEIEKYSELARNNLEAIEACEKSVILELNAMHATAKSETVTSVDEKRHKLKKRIQLPARRKTLISRLEHRITSMSQTNFLKQQDDLNRECDKLQELFADYATDVIDYDDIGCALIPSTNMKAIEIDNFCQLDKAVLVNVDDSTGETWKISIAKGDVLAVEISPVANGLLSASRQFTLFIEICNSDISKTIRNRFKIQRQIYRFELAEVNLLTAGGYLSGSKLVLRIAIQPLNVVEACAHYKQKVEILQKAVNCYKDSADNYKNSLILSEQTCKNIKKDLYSLRNSSVGHFFINYGAFACSQTSRYTISNIYNGNGYSYVCNSHQYKQLARYVSPQIFDLNGVGWTMVVAIDPFGEKSSFGAFITPSTSVNISGYTVRFACFIELLHSNPEKNIKRTTEHIFSASAPYCGWLEFAEITYIQKDVSFQRNGGVWFRFGVLPLAQQLVIA